MAHESSILIIDDQPESLSWLHDLFSEAGYRVLLADSGEMALSAVSALQPDLILLDVVMLGLDGFEVCLRLKALDATRHIPVVFLSARDDAGDRIKGFKAGGVDFIHKPFQEEEALLRVKTQCDLRRLQQNLEQVVRDRTEALELEIAARAEAHSRLQATLNENGVLLRELQHRAKNSFSMILGMMQLASFDAKNPESAELVGILINRVRSIADLYSLLYAKGSVSEISLDEYLSRIAGTLVSVNGKHRLETRLSAVRVEASIAAPLGLIVTELVTNSLKYAFPDRTGGTISLNLGADSRGTVLEIADDGIGLPASCQSGQNQGTGLNLVRALCEQIQADLIISQGPACRISIRLSA